jgi:segregation and condensation protein A
VKDYTVRLEQVFQGPMDLLLHLVREQEVEIQEIEISKILDSYLTYLKALEQIDIEVAGEFLVMAATLMAIKSRSLLPSESIDLEEELDPRDELIQRLIEYRHFKSASRELEERKSERELRFAPGRHPEIPTDDAEQEVDMGEVTHWDLLSIFSRLMRETLAHKKIQIEADDRPLRWYVDRLVSEIRLHRNLSLRSLVDAAGDGATLSKPMLIGTFCALLELMKIGAVRAHQASPDADVTIVFSDDVGEDLDALLAGLYFEEEQEEVDAPFGELAVAAQTTVFREAQPPPNRHAGLPAGAKPTPESGIQDDAESAGGSAN